MNDTNFRGQALNLRAITVIFWAFLIASAALAGDDKKAEIVIAVDGDDDATQVMRFVGDEADIVLDDLDVGETKTLTDTDGRQVTVQRTGKGLVFDVEGRTIELPEIHGEHHVERHAHAGGHGKEVQIEERREVRVVKSDADGGVTIISREAIDEATRERIREVLRDSGSSAEVSFVDTTEFNEAAGTGARKEVIIIRKNKDVAN